MLRPKILFLNRCYWPDVEASGQLLTDLCEDLAADFDVTVVAGRPNKVVGDSTARRFGRDRHNGVDILRVPHFNLGKRWMWGRALAMISYVVGAFFMALFAKRPDVIVVETDPFLLPLIGRILRWKHRCRIVVYVQDVYPDVAVALGKIREGRFTRFLRGWLHATYRRADRVVILGDDMREVLSSSRISEQRLVCIPNWADTNRILPLEKDNSFRRREGINGQFVVMYSGNMGLCQILDEVLDSADRLRHRSDLLFVLVGDGASKQRLMQSASERGLNNVRFLPYQPQSELSSSLSAADLHLIPLDPRVTGCLVPCKLYGILAAGVPALVLADEKSDTSRTVKEAGVGSVVPPGNVDRLAETISWYVDHRSELGEMGRKARWLAESEFDRKIASARFGQLIFAVLSGNQTASGPVNQTRFESVKTEPINIQEGAPTA